MTLPAPAPPATGQVVVSQGISCIVRGVRSRVLFNVESKDEREHAARL